MLNHSQLSDVQKKLREFTNSTLDGMNLRGGAGYEDGDDFDGRQMNGYGNRGQSNSGYNQNSGYSSSTRKNHNGYVNDQFINDGGSRNRAYDDEDYTVSESELYEEDTEDDEEFEEYVDADAGYDDYYEEPNQGRRNRSGPGDRRLDGGHDGRKKPGGNNPQGSNGTGNSGSGNRSNYNSNNNNRGSNNNNRSRSNNYNNNNQGGYGPYSTGKTRSGPGDRRLDGGHDGRKKPGGNNPQGYNGTGNSGSGNYSRDHNNRSNYNNNQDYDDDYGNGTYRPYSSGGNRSGYGDRRLDGDHDGRKRPGGNNPEGHNQYTQNNNGNNNNQRSRNRNYQNDYDDDQDDDDYNQNTRKYQQNNNSTGRQNRSGPGDRKLDGGKDRRKKPNRSDNYDDNY